MILRLDNSQNPQVKADLEKINALMESGIFLKGLGKDAVNLAPPPDFPIITDIDQAGEMISSQEIWDLPEPWPFQYFPAIAEDELGRLMYDNGLPYGEQQAIDRLLDTKYAQEGYFTADEIQARMKINQIAAFTNPEFAERILNEVDNAVHAITQGIYFAGGLDNTPVFKRFYEALLTGGMPCGWVGPMPEDGGDPVECLQLLHFGGMASLNKPA